MSRRFTAAAAARPHVHLLGAGDWTTMLTIAGTGFTQWRGLAISRWREDPVRNDWGSFLLLRDADSGAAWSATLQPQIREPDAYDACFKPHHVCYTRRDGDISSTLAIWASAAGDGQWRALTLQNHGTTPHTVDVFSCTELALGPAAADAAHPAFAKMFVQTAVHDDGRILSAWRRKSAPTDPAICAAHGCVAGAQVQALGYETDRMRFIGRGRNLRNAAALQADSALTGHVGSVLDPLFSLHRRVHLAAGTQVQLAFFTVAHTDPDALLQRARQCAKKTERVPTEADFETPQLDHYQHLSTPIFYSDPSWRAPASVLTQARGGQPSLWPHAISGDKPIVLVHVHKRAHLLLVHELLALQTWWQDRHVAVDLVMLVRSATDSDTKALLKALQAAAPSALANAGAAHGAFFVFDAAQLSAADRAGMAAAARVVLDANHGELAAQIRHAETLQDGLVQRRGALPPAEAASAPAPAAAPIDDTLHYFNGLGGFDNDGRDYVIRLRGTERTPMPWINVIANPDFGFTVSAEGGGYAWAVNSQQNTITPWSNDAVADGAGDLLYIRDLEHNTLWTATPDPIRAAPDYEIRHSQGYTRFVHQAHGIAGDLLQLLPLGATAKVSRLRLRNTGNAPRQLQITAYAHWSLGPVGATTAPHVVTAKDEATGALIAHNNWRADYTDRVAFADLAGAQQSWTCDRHEFLGALGTPANPAALHRDAPLAGRCGAGLDPCAALQTTLTLAPGQTQDVVFLLGEAATLDAARTQIQHLRGADVAQQLHDIQQHWQDRVGTVQVRTPDRGMDFMVNHWLPYQTISCRIDARTAFYQASGAYGFRDQLQDVGALTLLAPQRVREHLLRSASRQFLEGDAQHWWLPPTGAGVRTHMVDDRLWLPLMAAHYIEVTGDTDVLDEQVAFLQGRPLAAGQIDDFDTPEPSAERASLFEHCARAIEVSLATGAHGLPLFGTGDWNDGMNRVGIAGRGESVWMAWLLQATIAALAPLADARGEKERAQRWRAHSTQLSQALHDHAWDGQWWLRGWFDDGTPLGSSASTECRIDSIAQSWSVIAGTADPKRNRQAMASVDELLVNRDAQLVALLAPPFDRADPDPGYIRGYPPGLRENGGQYTHGSIWAAVAFALLGDGDRACELWHMFSPVTHSATPEAMAHWKVEPYVSCADVYTAPGHVGRGGWTWYTGSAGWLYRAAVEFILGLQVRGNELHLAPCIARDWPKFSIQLRRQQAVYDIHVANPNRVCRGIAQIQVNGATQAPSAPVPLQSTGEHRIEVTLG